MLKDIVQENVINIIVRLKLNISDVRAGLELFFSLIHPDLETALTSSIASLDWYRIRSAIDIFKMFLHQTFAHRNFASIFSSASKMYKLSIM